MHYWVLFTHCWAVIFDISMHQWIPCTVHETHKNHFSATFSLKMSLTALFTYLKIILLQCFQFSAVSKRALSIKTYFFYFTCSLLKVPYIRLSILYYILLKKYQFYICINWKLKLKNAYWKFLRFYSVYILIKCSYSLCGRIKIITGGCDFKIKLWDIIQQIYYLIWKMLEALDGEGMLLVAQMEITPHPWDLEY